MTGGQARHRLRRVAGRARRFVWEVAQFIDPVRAALREPRSDLCIALVCVYRIGNVELVRAALAGTPSGTTVRLWSLDGAVPGDLAGLTTGTGPGGRFELLNRLVRDIPMKLRADGLILLDDDVRFVVGNLGQLVDAAAAVGVDLYQPAHTALSHANWSFVRRRAGVFARSTDFVEQGPIVGMSAAAQQVLLPLPEDMGMGWGVEVRWWSAAVLAGLSTGIIDAIATRHEGPTAQGYDRTAAEAVMATELDRVGLTDIRALQRTRVISRRRRSLRSTAADADRFAPAEQPSAQGEVSVVIPTFNRSREVARAVRALLHDAAVLEVIVVDDGSTDDTMLVLQTLCSQNSKLVPVSQQNAGAGRARQTGAEHARGDIILFLDDDVVPRAGLASAHLAAHREDPGRLVVGSMPPERPRRKSRHSIVAEIYADDYAICIADYERDSTSVLDHLWAGNMSLAREHVLRVGISDPVFDRLFYEDQDLGRRLRAAGVGAVFRPDLQVAHRHVGTLPGYLRDSVRQGQGIARLHERYPADVAMPTARTLTGRFPPPARLIVASTLRNPDVIGAIWCRTLLAAAHLTATLRLWSVQRTVVVLLRRVAQARGVGIARRTVGARG